MSNEELTTFIAVINGMGFNVIEFKQERYNGSPGIVEDNGRGATGTVLIRIAPLPGN
jgi:hypothetical protein